MTSEYVIEIMQRTLTLATMIAAPMLGVGLVVGILIAIFQAATQIQENTLSFVPKILAMGGALIATGHWCLEKLIYFTTTVIQQIEILGPNHGGM